MHWTPGNLQKPLPGDVSLLLRESFFCGRDGRPKVSNHFLTRTFDNLLKIIKTFMLVFSRIQLKTHFQTISPYLKTCHPHKPF